MPYLYMIKIKILESLTYRFQALSSMLIQVVLLIVNVFFWRAVYSGSDTVSGTTFEQMLTFTVISVLLNSFFSLGVEEKMRESIRNGNVAVDYIKPVNILAMYFAEDVGGIAVNMTQRALPLLLFVCVFIFVPLPHSFFSLLLFLVSAVLCFLILWFISAIFGLINYWLLDIGAIRFAKNHIIKFLSGSVVPIWFFPEAAQKLLSYLPFIYTYQTPVSIYIGKLSTEEALFSIAIQCLWVFVFFFLFVYTNKKAKGNIVVQGG